MRIDADTNEPAVALELTSKHRAGPAVTADAAWVGTQAELIRIDLDDHAATPVLDIGVETLGTSQDQLWITQPEAVVRLDLESGDELARVALDGAVLPGEVAVTADATWVADADKAIWRVDHATGSVVARIEAPNWPTTVAIGEGKIWVGAGGDETADGDARCAAVYGIDPVANEISTRTLVGPLGGPFITAHDGSVWARPHAGLLVELDAVTGEVLGAYDGLPAGDFASDVISAFGSLWVANWSDGSVWRLRL